MSLRYNTDWLSHAVRGNHRRRSLGENKQVVRNAGLAPREERYDIYALVFQVRQERSLLRRVYLCYLSKESFLSQKEIRQSEEHSHLA